MIRMVAERLQVAVWVIADEIRTAMAQSPDEPLEERQLWHELSSCILSSQVPYDLATAYTEEIDRRGLLHSSLDDALLEKALRTLLSTPIRVADRLRRYRFPCARATQLTLARKTIVAEFGSLSAFLLAQDRPVWARSYLVRHIPGVGPKQASMFLRNVKVTYDMAIIDRHVLAFMAIVGIGGDLPRPSSSLKIYERHEQHFRNHATDAGFEVGIYDWAVWIVMRAAKSLEAF